MKWSIRLKVESHNSWAWIAVEAADLTEAARKAIMAKEAQYPGQKWIEVIAQYIDETTGEAIELTADSVQALWNEFHSELPGHSVKVFRGEYLVGYVSKTSWKHA